MTEHDFIPRKKAPPVNSVEFDEQHGIQLGLIEATSHALADGTLDAHRLMEQLHIYSQVHFMSEQLLMRLDDHPDCDQHQGEHEQLLQGLLAIKMQVEKGELGTAHELLLAHEKKVLSHIEGWDRTMKAL